MSSKEKMKCRKIKKVLRYHTPNKVTHLEAYAHHLLMLFYPFRFESDLLSSKTETYIDNPNISSIVNENKQKFEPWGYLVEEALTNYIYQPKTDNSAEHENDDLKEEFENQNSNLEDEDSIVDFQVSATKNISGNTPTSQSDLMSNEEITKLISSLNDKQRQAFNIVI